jgi:hypothetical protein
VAVIHGKPVAVFAARTRGSRLLPIGILRSERAGLFFLKDSRRLWACLELRTASGRVLRRQIEFKPVSRGATNSAPVRRFPREKIA